MKNWTDEKCNTCKSKPIYGIERQNFVDGRNGYIGYGECKCIGRTITHFCIGQRDYGRLETDFKIIVERDRQIRLMLREYFDELISRNGGWNKYWSRKRIRLPGRGKPKYFIREK